MSGIVSGGEDPGSSAVNATKIQGPAAHDAPASGNPVLLGAEMDSTSTIQVEEGDVGKLRINNDRWLLVTFSDGTASAADGRNNSDITLLVDQAGSGRAHVVTTYGSLFAPDGAWDRQRSLGDTAGAGLGVSAVGARTPDSSEVKTLIVAIGATSAARATFLTPSSGKKVRVLSFRASAQNLTTDPDEIQVYFGTGAAVTTNAASIIGVYDTGTDGTDGESFPEGAGPIGAADEVLSWRTETETETGLLGILTYREE